MNGPVGSFASAVARSGGSLVQQVRAVVDPAASHPAGGGGPVSGWLAVTVSCEPSEMTTDPPLARFGDDIEVRVRPAPAGKGTELSARHRDPRPAGTDKEDGCVRAVFRPGS